MASMFPDRYGLPLSTFLPSAADAYIEGVDRMLSLQVEAEATLRRALAADPEFAMAHAVLALQLQNQTDSAGARGAIDRAVALAPEVTPREQSAIDAIEQIITAGGARTGSPVARRAVMEHVKEYPRDFLLVQQASTLLSDGGTRDRLDRVLHMCERLAPHYGDDWAFTALHAMRLQEVDRFDEARRLAERSLEGNPRNALAIHPLSHVNYETNNHEEGSSVLAEWLNAYEWSAPYHCHLSWHQALFELSIGRYSRVVEILNRDIAPVQQAQTLLPDASSLLWRLQLYGCVDGPLDWECISANAQAATGRAAASFPAAHAALWCAATGDETSFAKLVDGLREEDKHGHQTAGSVVLPLTVGLRAFAAASYDEAIQHMEPAMDGLVAIGGSNTQREVFTDTLLQAYLRAGRFEEAEVLLSQRLDRRDSARDFFWLSQAQVGLGQPDAATGSILRAESLWPDAELESPEQQAVVQMRERIVAAYGESAGS